MNLSLNSYILFWVCLIGLCMGSFFNVVILRSLSEESIIFPPSKCPKCGKKLKPWHNIPVLSYLFLRGKCAFCKEPISLQYPIIEILTSLLFASCFIKFGIDIKTVFGIIICSAFIIMSATDIKEQVVDCNIAIGLGILGLIYGYFINGNILDSILGLVAGALIIEIIARGGKLIFKKSVLGEADTYVAGAIGACFGLKGVLLVLLYSLFASMIFAVPMFLYKQYKQDNKSVCILSILFILSVLIFKTLVQNYLTMGIVVILGITLATMILKNIKYESTSTYLPLVPAFALGALYYLFF